MKLILCDILTSLLLLLLFVSIVIKTGSLGRFLPLDELFLNHLLDLLQYGEALVVVKLMDEFAELLSYTFSIHYAIFSTFLSQLEQGGLRHLNQCLILTVLSMKEV